MNKLLNQSGDISKRVVELEHKFETVEKKKQKLLTFNALGELTDRNFCSKNKQCRQELEQIRRELMELEQQRDSADDFKNTLPPSAGCFRSRRDAAQGLINKEFVEQYIDKIFATLEENGTMRLQIKIFTGETTDKYLSKLRGRAGHTFKKKIELN